MRSPRNRKRKVYKITGNTIFGLWDDFLAEIPAKKTINRASNVEFSNIANGWTVEIKQPYCCLIKPFKRREDAIQAEIEFINNYLEEILCQEEKEI